MTELEFIRCQTKTAYRNAASRFEAHPSAAHYVALQKAMADYQAACYELIEAKREAHLTRVSLDCWERATA